ncbi:hypothetical protein JCM10908_003303 [Rhodotorula pacifica]|uniref:deadenylation-dependent mRNA-decapping factor PAT1 n=1 Tax=Rhodotorula pacifica TaxID=1495444 RepID=UPI003178C28F
MASGEPYGQAVTDDDLAIYQFDSLGQESDLAHLLDDTDNDLNDETFGGFADDTAASRDFDFAGTTSRYLGDDAPPGGAGGAQAAASGRGASEQSRGVPKQLVPLSNEWATDSLLSSAPIAAKQVQSPWTSLDDDPLLSRAAGISRVALGSPSSSPSAAAASTAAGTLPPSLPSASGQQPSNRQVKTLEEVEAEMKARATALHQQAQQASSTAPEPVAGRPMTLEEVEADMLRRRQGEQQQPQPQQQQQQQQHQQQQAGAATHLPPGMSPQLQVAFPPGIPSSANAPNGPFGNLPPHILQTLPPQFPTLPPHIQHQVVAQRMAAFGHHFPPPIPGAAAGSPMMQPGGPLPFGALANSPGVSFSPAGHGVSSPRPPHHPNASNAPTSAPPYMAGAVQGPDSTNGYPGPSPGTPGPGFPPLGAAVPTGGSVAAGVGEGPQVLSTLFPPLPSQPDTVSSVQQQLEVLSRVGQAQHPSLMGAQLQALLQHAHAIVADVGKDAARTEAVDQIDSADADAGMKRQKAEELVRAVEQRILEHEAAEQMRKRKAMKIASMAKHNNLMSNSDKDFITRIQVSQLLTDDPYADDFYFHIMAAIKASRQTAILAATGGPGPQLGPQQNLASAGPAANRRPNRRDNAMNRMAQNVQRLVDIAKKRNMHESNTLSLDGALGKIATRTRSAPRPLLQVRPAAAAVPASIGEENGAPSTSGTAESRDLKRGVSTGQSLLTGAGLISTSSAVSATPAMSTSEVAGPLSFRQALKIIEDVYDCVLDLEQLRRIQPALQGAENAARAQYEQMTVEGEVKDQVRERWEESQRAVAEGEAKYGELVRRLWDTLRVMDPLDACTPHPFVALLAVPKGIRILPRAIRHLSAEQTLTILTLLVATFDTLDVVREASVLDQLDTVAESRQRRGAVEVKTEALLNALIGPIMAVVGQAPLRMVTGMLGLLMDRNDLMKVVRSKPGLAFLTILLSRAESLKQSSPAPEPADLEQWTVTFTHLFSILSADTSLLSLYPSSRLAAALPFGVAQYQSVDVLRPGIDSEDEPVWRFLASVAVCADAEQQQTLVTGVRDKVIENVRAARQITDIKASQAASGAPEKAAMKIRNVNLLLNALSLDASMIETE